MTKLGHGEERSLAALRNQVWFRLKTVGYLAVHFRPMMLMTIREIKNKRSGEVDSWKSQMPKKAVPATPTPVQMA